MQIIDFNREIGCKVISFPDGEKHLVLDPINRKEKVIVVVRIMNGDDLFLFMQLADILKRQCVTVETLYIPYLMGMRCDRLFDIDRPFTLGIVADVINSLGAEEVRIAEPHSHKTLELIHNSYYEFGVLSLRKPLDIFDMKLVAPDKGAQERYSADFYVVCKKVRDEKTGKLLDFEVEELKPCENEDLLVVDDLCDGGGTFVGLAPKLRELNPKSLNLCIVHAVQVEGIRNVARYYDNVYISDTYNKWEGEELPSNVTVFKVVNP